MELAVQEIRTSQVEEEEGPKTKKRRKHVKSKVPEVLPGEYNHLQMLNRKYDKDHRGRLISLGQVTNHSRGFEKL